MLFDNESKLAIDPISEDVRTLWRDVLPGGAL
jgi:hypothetical protein